MMASTLNINDALIIGALTSKRTALFSFDEEEQKQFIQEFIDKIVIHPSNSIDDFSAGTCKFFGGENGSRTAKNLSPLGDRFFNGGGEPYPYNTTTCAESF